MDIKVFANSTLIFRIKENITTKFTRPRNIPLYAVAMASVGIVFFAACLIYTEVKERAMKDIDEAVAEAR